MICDELILQKSSTLSRLLFSLLGFLILTLETFVFTHFCYILYLGWRIRNNDSNWKIDYFKRMVGSLTRNEVMFSIIFLINTFSFPFVCVLYVVLSRV